MMRKQFFMAVTISAVLFMAADSAWACKFLDNLCSRCRRPCNPAPRCLAVPECGLPKACDPVNANSGEEKGVLTIPSPFEGSSELPIETPKIDTPQPPVMPVEPGIPNPLVEKPAEPATDRAVEKPVEPIVPTPPVAEPPKKAEEPAEDLLVPEPPKKAAAPTDDALIPETPKAEPPKKEAEPADELIPEPPKKPAAEPADDLIPEPPKKPKAEADDIIPEPTPPAKPATEKEPEDDAFSTPPPVKDAEPAKQPEKPAAPKEEEKDPFSKNDAKEYRLWTDSTGEFQVKARFVGIVDGQVRLQKDNGRYVRIEMNLLCSADQNLIERIKMLAGNW